MNQWFKQAIKGVGIITSLVSLAGCGCFKCCEHDHDHAHQAKSSASQSKDKKAAESATYYGPTKLSDVKLSRVAIHGPAHLQDVQAELMMVSGPLDFTHIVLRKAKIMGPMHGERATCEELDVTGPLSFKALRVTGNTRVIGSIKESEDGQFTKLELVGPLEGHHFFADELMVTGHVDVSHLYVKKHATVIGSLKVVESEFKDLTVTADDIVLENSKTEMILVKKDRDKEQVLRLQGNTIVRGNIIFESGIGKVITNRDSQIRGVVKGATTEVE